MSTVQTPEPSTTVTPIIINLGKERKKRIRDLKRGRGKLMDDIDAILDEVRVNLGPEAENRQLVPVILIYRKKSRRRRKVKSLLPCLY